MKYDRIIIFCLSLLIPFVLHGQATAPLIRLPFQRWIETRSSDGKDVLSFAPPKEHAIAGNWSLSQDNITTELTDAYRYYGKIIAFGWSGNFNGFVTVIDAKSGMEQLQLLVNERSGCLTPSGALTYRHWFVKGAYEPDDRLWILDLNLALPSPRSLVGSVAEEVGTQIYPTSKDDRVRHQFSELVTVNDCRDLFLVDRPITPASPP